MENTTLMDLLMREASRLRNAGIPQPGLEAQLLAAYALGVSREEVIMRSSDVVSAQLTLEIQSLTDRRLAGEPLAYIRGFKEFWSLPFKVDRRVMIPRPETELLVERCLHHLRGKRAFTYQSTATPAWSSLNVTERDGLGGTGGGGRVMICDVGTGSGAIACALATEIEGALVVAIDLSKDALEVAAINVEALGLSGSVRLLLGDLLAPLRPVPIFDVLAANLPYVPTAMLKVLPEGIRDFEPAVALDGGPDGLAVIRRLLSNVEAYLRRGGILALEVEDNQVRSVLDIIESKGVFVDLGVDADLAGFKRVVWAQKEG